MYARKRVVVVTCLLVVLCALSIQIQPDLAPVWGQTAKRTLLQEDISFVNANNYGSAFTNATISAAIAAIGSSKRVLFLPTGTWTIGSSLTVPSNVTLYIPAGTVISVNGGNVLTLATIPRYDQPRWFTGAGTLVISDATWDIDVRTYGAAGDGVTDDTAAVSAAITAANTTGSAIVFACGTYLISSSLTVVNGTNIRLLGPSRVGGSSSCAELRYTAAASPLLWFDGTQGAEVGFLTLTYSNAAYAGTLLRIDQTSGSAAAQFIVVHDSLLQGTAASSKNAARLLLVQENTADVGIERNIFGNAQTGVEGAQSAASNVGNIRVRDNRFQNTLSSTAIKAGGLTWSIENNHFFVNTSGAGTALNTTTPGVTGLVYTGNTHAGTTNASTQWVLVSGGAITGGLFASNYFNDASAASYCLRLGFSLGISITGNSLNCGTGISIVNAGNIMALGNNNASTVRIDNFPTVGNSLTQAGNTTGGTSRITLGTAGAAGLKIVCFNSSTGQLILSNSGTDCS